MCGISGIVSPGLSPDETITVLKKMTDVQIFRGPDDEGSFFDESAGVGLAHRRLSVIDISPTGAQPMHSKSRRLTLSFNGEIYNFKEIRKRLTDGGAQFYGHSDTEVLLEAIDAWGIGPTLQRCRGAFAFGLLDRKTQNLVLARDAAGEKPLYYSVGRRGVAFSSQLKSFKHVPFLDLEIDPQSVSDFMFYSYVPQPYSIFKKYIQVNAREFY